MDRTRINSDNRRIISVPNGLWQLQQFTKGGPGQKKSKGVPHRDPWMNCGLPTDKETALGLLRLPQIKTVAAAPTT